VFENEQGEVKRKEKKKFVDGRVSGETGTVAVIASVQMTQRAKVLATTSR
jgi:hypothetical protein